MTVTGTPAIAVTVGSETRSAGYVSTDERDVIFEYDVVEGDEDTDGIQISADSITLGSDASIRNASGDDATLAHHALAAKSAHKVDGVRPRVTVSEVAASTKSYPYPINVYAKGDSIFVRIEYSEPVIHHRDKSPTLSLNIGGSEKSAVNNCRRDGYYSYEVQDGDFDRDGVVLVGSSVTFPDGGYIKDVVGNDAVITHAGHAPGSWYKVDAKAPEFRRSRTRTDGKDVIVFFDENIALTANLLRKSKAQDRSARELIEDAFIVRVDGVVVPTVSVRYSGRTVTLVLEEAVTSSQSLTVAFADTLGGVISDEYRNDLKSFAAQRVANNSEVTGAGNDPSAVDPEPAPSPTPAPTPAPKLKPSDLVASSSNGQVTLAWAPSNDKRFVNQQVLRRAIKRGQVWTVTATVGKDGNGYVDDDVEVGTRYAYRIKAVKSNGKGPATPVVRIQAE